MFLAGGTNEYIENSNYRIFARTLYQASPVKVEVCCSVLHSERRSASKEFCQMANAVFHLSLSFSLECHVCSLISSLTTEQFSSQNIAAKF
jgi:predicted amidophosphoribosyltransferase